MARNITLIEGTVSNIDIYQNDPTATSATLYMRNDETNALISKTAPFVNDVATIELDGNDTTTPGVYSYQVNENLGGGGIAKYGTFECEDCEWGKIIICEALDGGIS